MERVGIVGRSADPAPFFFYKKENANERNKMSSEYDQELDEARRAEFRQDIADRKAAREEALERLTKNGNLYFGVKVPTTLSKEGEIYLHADTVDVIEGAAVFSRQDGHLNLIVAPGQWQAVFAASVWDGHACAVEHWAGEVNRG